MAGKGNTPMQVHEKLRDSRKLKGQQGPSLDAVRRALKGKTHKRGRKETRGRKPKLTPFQLKKLNQKRVQLIKKADNDEEVHIEDVMAAAGINHVNESTVSRHFNDKLGIQWRAPREKPLRTTDDEKERETMLKKWKYLPGDYFTDQVDGILDIKCFQIPTSDRARKFFRGKRVRGHLRTKKEGLTKGFVRPKSKKNQVNPGARVSVAALIIDCKVRVWYQLPSRWTAQAACDLYENIILKAMKKYRGEKSSYKLVEDNDPSGFKSKKALEKKKELKINTVPWPRYSPDVMPHDYWLWTEVLRQTGEPHASESGASYKARLSKVALGLRKPLVKKAVLRMKEKAAEIVEARGGNICSD